VVEVAEHRHACTRAQYSAPKKAAKNITSEKMNQLMLQRNETSMRSEYRPLSLSRMASLNHWNITVSQITMPASSTQAPQPAPLTHWPAPRITRNRPKAIITGWREGPG
jgi:hypothetical protein